MKQELKERDIVRIKPTTMRGFGIGVVTDLLPGGRLGVTWIVDPGDLHPNPKCRVFPRTEILPNNQVMLLAEFEAGIVYMLASNPVPGVYSLTDPKRMTELDPLRGRSWTATARPVNYMERLRLVERMRAERDFLGCVTALELWLDQRRDGDDKSFDDLVEMVIGARAYIVEKTDHLTCPN